MALAATRTQENLPMAELKPDRIKLMIPISNEVGGKEDVTVGVNGDVIVIKRGKTVAITQPYYDALKNAVVEKHYKDEDGKSQVEYAPRFSISLLG